MSDITLLLFRVAPAVCVADVAAFQPSPPAPRLALSLRKHEGAALKIFLLGDAVSCARTGQKTPEGFYNLERMLKGLTTRSIPVGACGSCMDARGLTDAELLEGVHRSSMDELTNWTMEAEKVLVF